MNYSLSHSSNATTLNSPVFFFLFPLSRNLRYLCVCVRVPVRVCVCRVVNHTAQLFGGVL